MKNLLLALILMCGVTGLVMANDDISSQPGYVNFDSLESEYGEAKVLINLNKTMLGFMSKLNAAGPATAELFSKLKAVRVQVYDIDKNEQPALELISKVTEEITRENWMPVVSINEPDEKIRIFTKLTDDIMDGLVVMTINEQGNGREAVFINIVGEIDPAQINQVTDSLNINVGIQ
mgnify:CR=1 FL=1